jgi:hypothetical protein
MILCFSYSCFCDLNHKEEPFMSIVTQSPSAIYPYKAVKTPANVRFGYGNEAISPAIQGSEAKSVSFRSPSVLVLATLLGLGTVLFGGRWAENRGVAQGVVETIAELPTDRARIDTINQDLSVQQEVGGHPNAAVHKGLIAAMSTIQNESARAWEVLHAYSHSNESDWDSNLEQAARTIQDLTIRSGVLELINWQGDGDSYRSYKQKFIEQLQEQTPAGTIPD